MMDTKSPSRVMRRRARRRKVRTHSNRAPRFESLEPRLLLCALLHEVTHTDAEGNTTVVPVLSNQMRAPLVPETAPTAASEGGGSGSGEAPTAQSPHTEGAKSVLYIRVDFSDLQGEPVSDATVASVMAGVDTFFTNSSYGLASLPTYTLTETLRMPKTADEYRTLDPVVLRNDALAAAQSAGYTPNSFWSDITAYKYLGGTHNFGGLGYVGARGTWLNGSFGLGVTAHELGHNLGAWHSGFWNANDGSYLGGNPTSSFIEYGSIYDVMGSGGGGAEYNAQWRRWFDWLDPSEVRTPDTSGVYRLYAIDENTKVPGEAYVFTVERDSGSNPNGPPANYVRNYWFEYRRDFPGNPNMLDGVLVSVDTFTEADGDVRPNNHTTVLDMTRDSTTNDVTDAGLRIGSTFDTADDTGAQTLFRVTPIANGVDSIGSWIDLEFRFDLGAKIGGRVFEDMNNNGVKDSSETWMSGVTVYLDQNDNGVADGDELTETTTADGMYLFAGLFADTYNVRVDESGGHVVTTPGSGKHVVTVSGEEESLANDFGLYFNYAPVALNDAYSLLEDGSLTVNPAGVLLNDSDRNGDLITPTLVSTPGRGTVVFNPDGSFTYTPQANYRGPDGFLYKVNDGVQDSALASVTLTIHPVNDPPTATPQTVNVNEDTAIDITLTGTDIETPADQLIYTIVNAPTNGVLSHVSGQRFRYAPNPNYQGPDSFQFTVKDAGDPTGTHGNPGDLTSAPATVNLNVLIVNDTPTAVPGSVTVAEDTSVEFNLVGADQETSVDNLIYTITKQPAHGALAKIGTRRYRYTPVAEYNGPDAFQFTVTDSGDPAGSHANPGDLTSAEATFSITVQPVNDMPVATPGSAVVAEDSAINILLSGIDLETTANGLIYTVTQQPAHGSLFKVNARTYRYTPNPNYNGPDEFFFEVRDSGDPVNSHLNPGDLTSTPARISLMVTPVNDKPTATGQAIALDEDEPLAIILGGTDVETVPEDLAVTITLQPAHGVLERTGPRTFIYTPTAEYNGPDSFRFTVTDTGDPAGGGGSGLTSNPATVNLTVNQVNDIPVALNQPVWVNEDGSIEIVLVGIDPETGTENLSYAITTPPAHGGLTQLESRRYRYTPAGNFNGTDSFQFAVTDSGDPPGSGTGTKTSAPGTVSITVGAVNDPPTAHPQNIAVGEDGSVEFTITGQDLETPASSLIFAVTDPPDHGTLTPLGAGAFRYVPHPNKSGADSFQFTVTDTGDPAGTNAMPITSQPATVGITVHPVNDRPVALGQSIQLDEDIATAITLVGVDAETGTSEMTYTIVTPPQHGTLTPISQMRLFVYTPDLNYNGPDSFQYTVTDKGDPTGSNANPGPLMSEPGTVTIQVRAVNDAPTISVLDTLGGGVEDTQRTVTFEELAAAANEADVDSPNVIFRIASFGVGTITVGGSPVTPGATTIGPGQSVAWTPPANAHGTLTAFYVTAFDLNRPSINSMPVKIAVTSVNDPPTLTTIGALGPTLEDTPLGITFATLVAAANETDIDNDPLTFRIEAVLNGTLTLGGAPVVPGVTTFAPTQSLSWTPPPDATGDIPAFSVVALDGSAASATPVPARVHVTPVNDPPHIATLAVDPQGVEHGGTLTLRPLGVGDIDSTVSSVRFYRDTNGNGRLDPGIDPLLGADTDPSDGWSIAVVTQGLAIGDNLFFAEARDTAGAISAAVSTVGEVYHVMRPIGRQRLNFAGPESESVVVTLSGPGTFEVILTSLTPSVVDSIIVTGSTPASVLKIATRGRGSATTLGDIVVHGSLKKLIAPTTHVENGVTIDGAAKVVKVPDAGHVLIGGAGARNNAAVALIFDRPQDMSITSAIPISLLKAREWLDRDGTPDKISAPLLRALRITGHRRGDVAGNFEADLDLGGAGVAGSVLGSAIVAGAIQDAAWSVGGRAGKLVAGAFINADIDVLDQLNRLTVRTSRRSTLPNFLNTSIRADAVTGALNLGVVETDNAGNRLGITAAQFHRSVVYRNTQGNRSILRPTDVPHDEDDLRIALI